MSKHTPEPWVIYPEECGVPYIRIRGSILGVRFKIANVITPTYEGAHERETAETRANAVRIVSCVNACAGMEDPMAEIAELKRQRDELLGLIKAVTAHAVMVRVDGTDCAAIPYFEYKVISDKVRGR